MQHSQQNTECPPLMEACTLDLYKKNIFRITGLPVDATSKEVSRQVQKLQMLEEMGGGDVAGTQPAFTLAGKRSSDEIRDALSRMKEPEHRLIDEFFWFWPEEFGASKDDPAIQAMLAGDKQTALQLWRDREKSGSHVAQHNMAIIYHMYAVDWTNSHIEGELDEDREDEIKACWQKAFDRWEPMIEADELWDMLKERARSLNDEVLTTGFVRRILKILPEALDRVNAKAALKLAEQGRIDWAKFHINFMRETHPGLDDVDSTSEMVLEPTKKRVEQYLESFAKQVEKAPQRGADLANELLDRCRPMMNLFDLFHGEDAHQRNDIFDQVAETILQMVVTRQKATGDNQAFFESAQDFVKLAQEALEFASGVNLRERIIKNISIVEEVQQKQQIEERLQSISKIIKHIAKIPVSPQEKYAQIIDDIIPKLPGISSQLGALSKNYSKAYESILNVIAVNLGKIAVKARWSYDDFDTARKAIDLAQTLVKCSELKIKLTDDAEKLAAEQLAENSLIESTKSSSGCLFLILIPSLVAASAIYSLINQIT
jgi:hypothetical protein